MNRTWQVIVAEENKKDIIYGEGGTVLAATVEKLFKVFSDLFRAEIAFFC